MDLYTGVILGDSITGLQITPWPTKDPARHPIILNQTCEQATFKTLSHMAWSQVSTRNLCKMYDILGIIILLC